MLINGNSRRLSLTRITLPGSSMKTRLLPGFFAFLTLAVCLVAGNREAQWQKVESARDQKLPKSAIAALEPIIAGALADKAYAEAIKALGQKIALEREIEGNQPEEQVVRIQAELAKAPPEMKPALEAVLARWYWHYFQANRGRFLQRTQTAAEPGLDFLTWDLARILTEIDRHFTAALADEATLQRTPINTYDDLLEKGTAPDAYRPTLYDFLVQEALAFYQTGEQGAVRSEDAFELDADGPIFADADTFARWKPESTDTNSPILKAIALYQKLLDFHRDDRDRSAYLDADLARLTYGHNTAVGPEKEERYRAALERFIQAAAKHEISARALATLAARLNEAGEPTRAHELVRRGLAAYPKSVGGNECYNLLQQIEAKSATLQTESVWNAPWPTLDVTYRNVTQVHFRVVPANFKAYVTSSRWGYGRIDRNQAKAALAIKPLLEWQADLPATEDFRPRTESLPVPTTLKPGFYYILSSLNPNFSDEENEVNVATVWVSDLSLITRQHQDGQPFDGFVLQAGSGEPVAGATVQFWERRNDGELKTVDRVLTDQNGRFQGPTRKADRGIILLAEHGGQAVASTHELNSWQRENPDQALAQTVFFTDRALYRPGQTISYKGICIRRDASAASYETLARRAITVVFLDANNKEITRASHTTNAYGSFSGSFTAPRNRLLGAMALRAEGKQPGWASFRVEEYKRPKFQVEILPPAEAAKLGALARLTVKATAYTGTAIGGAKVQWRVTRAVQLPVWCWWWSPQPDKAVAHGTAVTAADGTFEVHFVADPDRTVPEKDEPVFTFSIHADVTDSAGETRSADRRIRVGYTALQANLTANEWQTPEQPVAFRIDTNSLDGVPQEAVGRLTIRALRQPANVMRTPLQQHQPYWWRRNVGEPKDDPTNPDTWEPTGAATERPFQTDASGQVQVSVPLPAGIYRASLETKDRFGKRVTARQTVQVLDPQATRYGIKIANHFTARQWSVEPGDRFTALWGTGYDTGRAFVELERAGQPLKGYWTDANRTQEVIELPVTEEMRGGVTMRVTYVRENRAYLNERIIEVPWTNKVLAVKWESFRSKLLPGQPETWTAVVTGPEAKRATAEMVAALYDASLDQFAPHSWIRDFGIFRQEFNRVSSQFQNTRIDFNQVLGNWSLESRDTDWRYRTFSEDLGGWGYFNDDVIVLSPFSVRAEGAVGYMAASSLAGSRLRRPDPMSTGMGVAPKGGEGIGMPPPPEGVDLPRDSLPDASASSPDLSQITARKNLNETAFFFPHLLTDDNGTVRMQFTMPEALTEWKFLGFAHDTKLRAGFLTAKAVTAKDLMVEPNPPRFVREGDTIEFTVKVSNQTDQPQAGRVRLTFADAATLAPADDVLGNRETEQAFEVPAKQSRTYAWRIAVPDGLGFLTYKAVGASAAASDGEEGYLPVLSRRILVTESLPLPIRGKTSKEFAFTKLLESGKSDTLRHQSLTVQMVSQPAWYAVMALPYLMEFPHECSEQLFSRYYANALARHIAGSDPKIRRVFDLWKNTPALDSQLVNNQDLKSVMIEETPWLRQATRESTSRRNVGLLFDPNRLDEESSRALRQLTERQLGNGLWSWFPGGPSSEYISLTIATGFGRLRHLGVKVDPSAALRSLKALDAWMAERHREILKGKHPEQYVPGNLDALYLYGRSFFLPDQPIASAHQAAVDFFLGQARQFWPKVASRQSEAHLALALQRFGDQVTPQAIMKSLKERSISSEELGMFWRDQGQGWWWYHAPIETQAIMIEVFDEVAHDAQAVENCKVWLLKQKQTQDWKTTKATADAVYGLLLRGADLLSSDQLVEVALAGETIKPETIEAGTGFYEQKFVRAEIKPAMGRITVRKVDAGVSWGSAHWQYLEDMAKVTPHEDTPLKLKKTLWVKATSGKGQMLKPVNGPLAVGDEIVVRLELRTDRDMEYVHLKDQRGSGTEPVNVLSRYHYQDGLGYYESTRDTASHFFIERLPRGTYVFEYSTRVQLRGSYQTGIAEIQCMYAPEFNSHSESLPIEVK